MVHVTTAHHTDVDNMQLYLFTLLINFSMHAAICTVGVQPMSVSVMYIICGCYSKGRYKNVGQFLLPQVSLRTRLFRVWKMTKLCCHQAYNQAYRLSY